LNTLLDVLNP